MRGNDVSLLVRDLMEKGLSRRTAYYRLKGKIKHCPSCSCGGSQAPKQVVAPVEPEYVEEQRATPLDSRIDRVKLQELRGNAYCPKHDVKKNKCLCP